MKTVTIFSFVCIAIIFSLSAKAKAKSCNVKTLSTEKLNKQTQLCSNRDKLAKAIQFAEKANHNATAGNFRTAILGLSKAIDLQPNMPSYYNSRGEYYLALAEYAQALSDLNKAIELNSGYYKTYLTRGLLSYRRAHYNAAIADYSKALSIQPRQTTALMYRGLSYYLTGHKVKALQDLDQLLNYEQNNRLGHFYRGLVLNALGKKVDADNAFKRYVNLHPAMLLDDKQHPSYVKSVQSQVKLEDNGKGVVIFGSLRYGLANAFRKVLAKNPGISYVRLQEMGGKQAEAFEFAKLIKQHKLSTLVTSNCYSACTIIYLAGKERLLAEGARIGFHQGINKWKKNKGRKAKRRPGVYYRYFLSKGVSRTFINKTLQFTHKEMWYPETSELLKEKIVSRVVQYSPEKWKTHKQHKSKADAYFEAGMLLVSYGAKEASVKMFSSAIKYDDTHVDAVFARSYYYQSNRKYQEALYDMNHLVSIDPTIKVFYKARARLNMKLKKYNAVIADYNQIIKMEPNNAAYYFWRAKLYSKLNRYELSINDYSQVIRLKPQSSASYNNRAWDYYRSGLYIEGLHDAHASIRLNAKNVNAYDTRGRLYAALGLDTLAQKDFAKVQQLKSRRLALR